MTADTGTDAIAGGRRAGFWVRFAAAFVDGLIVSLVATILQQLDHGTGRWIGVIVAFAYFIGLEGGSRGAGLGKQLFQIQVVDRDHGGPIGYPRAMIRRLGHIVSAIPLLLGYFWMLWDPERRCWHDMFAEDLVVPMATTSPGPAWGRGTRY